MDQVARSTRQVGARGVEGVAVPVQRGDACLQPKNMELDEITTESLEHEMSQEESEWMRCSAC